MNLREEVLLAELAGFLRAFAWVNTKCDNGFDFRVEYLNGSSDVETAVARKFSSENILNTAVEKKQHSREFLSNLLIRWLLCYLNDEFPQNRLQDDQQNVSLSHPECFPQLLTPILDALETLVPFPSLYIIELTTKGFYACDSDDIVLAGNDRMLFLHFSVSD